MPVTKTIAKRIRQAEKARIRNKHYNSMMKSAIKKAMAADNAENATALGHSAMVIIDKVAGNGIIHKNKAANQKSRIAKHMATFS
ncbi:MAG: 30S ribosomal protein S20 [Candidatus Marinimicrobia bacterium]|jgi:small subunit ribosomal protein S20|nr:30S ribosomal protein S20 [Candidatus Neomarinimicrobiota bacterium]MBT3630034.1 30S ribosomal protein S20 [Candidatus Neomarinimicrobiota bacterium]MBT3823853.1 30S ribosomal protein S20 [Candidatus Neomarinimicrobiota bacterium]MBT4130134.1 30S ribosomal protein S20 [Candidatus Neomarinimicrobiota bacterium]MBT4295517.1 30S ribosomal protein S20 [Candidatus Neomarinimicrobiota bacterium]